MAWLQGQFDDFASYPVGPGGDGPRRAAVPTSTTSKSGSIASLQPGIWDTAIIGVIIAKEDPRSFLSKKDPGKERHILNFVLRDSAVDFINVSCWGNEEYVKNLATQYHIGDVVELNQVVVQSKPQDGSDEKFRVSTPSLYQLSMSENKSTVRLYSGWDVATFTQLLHVPARPSNDYYAIGDILANGQAMHGEVVSMLALVRGIGQVKDLQTKLGKPLKRCEVKLFDQTANSFPLVLWDEELISLAQTWTPKDIVLFAADVRVTHDDYRKCMVATATAKSIITVNPDTREAHQLFQYSQTAAISDDPPDKDFSTSVPLDSISAVYTVEQLKSMLTLAGGEGGTEHGISYSFINSLNIDGHVDGVMATRCSKCRRRVSTARPECTNQDCPQGSCAGLGGMDMESDREYDINLALTDHTGTLSGCHLTGDAAAQAIGMGLEDFMCLQDEEKTNVKWKLLLERCKVYLKLTLPSYEWPRPQVRILSCVRADPQEAAKFLQ